MHDYIVFREIFYLQLPKFFPNFCELGGSAQNSLFSSTKVDLEIFTTDKVGDNSIFYLPPDNFDQILLQKKNDYSHVSESVTFCMVYYMRLTCKYNNQTS